MSLNGISFWGGELFRENYLKEMTIMPGNHKPNLFLFASNLSIEKAMCVFFCCCCFFNSASGDIQQKNDKAKQQSGHFL